MDNPTAKKVMVFGVFDRLHPGHLSFLEQASKYGDVIAVITRDEMVRALKKKIIFSSDMIRVLTVEDAPHVSQAVLGDAVLGSYDIVRKHKPDIICLGYDQQVLADDLRMRMDRGEIDRIGLEVMQPFEPEKYHTSLLS